MVFMLKIYANAILSAYQSRLQPLFTTVTFYWHMLNEPFTTMILTQWIQRAQDNTRLTLK